jgi:small-conductance mechanosensitive channel
MNVFWIVGFLFLHVLELLAIIYLVIKLAEINDRLTDQLDKLTDQIDKLNRDNVTINDNQKVLITVIENIRSAVNVNQNRTKKIKAFRAKIQEDDMEDYE